ncbi:hypothetical protein B0T16DRAFT_8438 [Cercophora newfieldiana]|uniref:Uncharacterized protein n=1 Tax=Cercophora newfieldiana TaxID=92897 RepID=A0AA40CZZ1_9PEZI|nr:hypothetical protein B0T16DRAFT_8438 [Cercophora newfieldiana]
MSHGCRRQQQPLSFYIAVWSLALLLANLPIRLSRALAAIAVTALLLDLAPPSFLVMTSLSCGASVLGGSRKAHSKSVGTQPGGRVENGRASWNSSGPKLTPTRVPWVATGVSVSSVLCISRLNPW